MSKASKAWYGIRFAAIGSLSKGMELFNREWGRQYLVREISRMPGIPAKAAQFLEMKYGHPGWKLHSGIAYPIEWVKERIASEVPALAEEILEISEEGITASLGQVHWAKLISGREVAIKVQYPEVGNQIEEQLDLLLSSLNLVSANRKYGLDTEEYRKFLQEFFQREVNYELEAENQAHFRAGWEPLGGVIVPEVFPTLSNRRILVQSFENAAWLDSLATAPESIRAQAGQSLARLSLLGGMGHCLVHTDMHPRNWGYRTQAGQLVLYDFGATLRLDAGMRRAMQDLFLAPKNSQAGCMDQLGEIGFDAEKLAPIAPQLPAVLHLLGEPFRHQGIWNPSEWKVSERLEALLGGDRWWFRVAGPPWFLFFMRGLFGALEAIERLNVAVDLQKILGEAGLGSPIGQSLEGVFAPVLGAIARTLRVKVTEGATVVVELELPARAVEDLELVVPSHVLERLEAQGINVFDVKKKALESGLVPQELFQAKHGNRTYRVWIQ